MKSAHLIFVYSFLLVHAAGAYTFSDSNAYNNTVTTFEANGAPANGITVAGGNGFGTAANQLAFPYDVVADAAGNVYVVDEHNNRIQKWAPGASAGVTVAGGITPGMAADQLNGPTSVFVDQAGNVYVADSHNDRIQKWAPGASAGTTVAGGNSYGSAANQFNVPTGVFVDASGNIYVADRYNHRIQKWAPGASAGITVAGGNGQGSAANQLNSPFSIFVDAPGNMYVADLGNHRIQKWAPGASAGVTVAGGNGQGSAANQLSGPNDVFVDAAGNMYIADPGNSRIQKWAPGASEGTTVAGGNGYGTAANQITPYGVFADAAGNIYVADVNSARVQKFAAVPAATCAPNQTVAVPSCSDKAIISWNEPHDTFPATVSVKKGIHLSSASLIYKGTFNGHGYYQSDDEYSWADANDAANGAGAHLVTITSAAENNFVFANLNQRNNYAWIGLYNTGTVGSFAWVTGEAVSYTNWIPGQPDNLYNDPAVVHEPYVHINGWADSLCRWNDNGVNFNAGFIAEFDSTAHTYRQISGPVNGSAQSPGMYNICYERTTAITGQKDTCCFSIAITCSAPVVTTAHDSIVENNTVNNKGLRITTSPNPSSTSFRLNIAGDDYQRINVQVSDVLGRMVEARYGIAPNQAVEIGINYGKGVYFARVMQGTNKMVVKLIKQ